MEEVTIRRLTAEHEIQSALALADRVFERFVAPYYAPQGAKTFHRHTAWENNRAQAASGEYVFYGAFDGETLMGAAASRQGGNRVMLLFVEERYQHRGVASALMKRLLADAPGPVVTVGASPYAHKAYERMGFEQVSAAQTVDGMTFYPMEYHKR